MTASLMNICSIGVYVECNNCHILTGRDPSSNFFFFTDPSTTEIYTLSLHDALPISTLNFTISDGHDLGLRYELRRAVCCDNQNRDRKSTRLNSSHVKISYAVFCLKKKKKKRYRRRSLTEKTSHYDLIRNKYRPLVYV